MTRAFYGKLGYILCTAGFATSSSGSSPPAGAQPPPGPASSAPSRPPPGPQFQVRRHSHAADTAFLWLVMQLVLTWPVDLRAQRTCSSCMSALQSGLDHVHDMLARAPQDAALRALAEQCARMLSGAASELAACSAAVAARADWRFLAYAVDAAAGVHLGYCKSANPQALYCLDTMLSAIRWLSAVRGGILGSAMAGCRRRGAATA